MSNIFNTNATVLENIKVNPQTFRLILKAPKIASHVVPGQFCMVKTRDNSYQDPLLRRPFSINRVKEDNIHILYRIVGKGTQYMSNLSKGDKIELLGPLGNGFTLKKDTKNILVAGGMGIAPISFLATRLPNPKDSIILIGAANRDEIFDVDYLKRLGINLLIATDDGSLGKKAFVTDLLRDLLNNLYKKRENIMIYSCGPYPMLKALANICKEFNIRAQVSMEAKMACGIGLCLGCVISGKDEKFLHVCKDGPVFYTDDIYWS